MASAWYGSHGLLWIRSGSSSYAVVPDEHESFHDALDRVLAEEDLLVVDLQFAERKDAARFAEALDSAIAG